MPLTETRLRALKPKDKPYKVADDRGLYIKVSPSGGKLWRFRYRISTAEKKLSIGSYPEINLKDARQAAYEARVKVAGTTYTDMPTSGSFMRSRPVSALSSPPSETNTLPMFVPHALPAHRFVSAIVPPLLGTYHTFGRRA